MKINVLGVNIDALTKEELLNKIRKRLNMSRSVFIVTPYSEMIVAAQKDTGFREILNSADFALPDGIGILWAANYLYETTSLPTSPQTWGEVFPSPGLERGQGRGRKLKTILKLISSLFKIIFSPQSIRNPIPEQISGAELIWELTELAESRGESIFLLGGYNDTPELAAASLKLRFPNLKIAGTASPVIARGETPRQSLVDQINSSSASFLFIALGPKKQEKWIYNNLPKLRVKLAIGLGGTFDYLAKKRPYRPRFWALRGLEWAWRLLTQPWRIWRILRGVGGLIYFTFRANMSGQK